MPEGKWAARWRSMVQGRATQIARLRLAGSGDGYWEARAGSYRTLIGLAQDDEPLVALLRGWLSPGSSLLDVGAGSGRYALPLAPLVRELIAVEPSAAMAAGLRAGVEARGITNLRLIERRWEEVQGEQADVVVCAHVLYPIADVAPFIRALDAAARWRCVLALRIAPSDGILRQAWLDIHKEEPLHDPALIEAYNVLWELGIHANVQIVPSEPRLRFPGRSEALAWARGMLWLGQDDEGDAILWRHLERLLEPGPDGSLMLPTGAAKSTIVWWEKG